MASTLRERLPAALQHTWEELLKLESVLLARLPEEDLGGAAALADRHSLLLRQLCESLEHAIDPDLREAMLRDLLSRNEHLQTRGKEALAQASAQSAAGVHQRRAMTAYGARQEVP